MKKAKHHTALCDLLGIRLPIVQAPIGSATCPQLAAAVSNCGGLGMLSVTWRPLDEIRAVIRETRSLTSKPFGINLVLDQDVFEKLDVCLQEGVRIVSLFWGAPRRYIQASHEAGALVMHTVGSVLEARNAIDAGADALVAQGWEAGGHVCGSVSTMALVPAVVDAVAPVPVMAAGGISDGRGIAAALTLGASGVWLGTRFVACEEATAHPSYQRKLLSADATDTVYSSLFDVGWEKAPHRTLRNTTLEMWEQAGRPAPGTRPQEGEEIAQKEDGSPIVRYSVKMPLETMEGDVDGLALYAGQGVGLVEKIQPAAQIVQQLETEFEQAIRVWRDPPPSRRDR